MPFLQDAWYCAAFAHEVASAPFARRILDKPILFARQEDGTPCAISDRCPHRFAPLHTGRRVNDLIECPYHGLRFDLTGACRHNPHGDGCIPAAAKLRSYPVVESQGLLWVWTGNIEKADPALVPNLRLFSRAAGPLGGHLRMPVDYRLIMDNLLDLSHAPYLHAGTLSPAGATRESKFEVGDASVGSFYAMRDVATPLSQALFYPGERGDYFTQMEWLAPSVLLQGLTMTDVGAAPEDGANMRGAHLITPETAQSSHYFWISSRDRLTDNAEIDAQLAAIVTRAFLDEDEPMIADCQAYMNGHEFFALKPLYLQTDFAGTRCRRILERLIAAEAGQVSSEITQPKPFNQRTQ